MSAPVVTFFGVCLAKKRGAMKAMKDNPLQVTSEQSPLRSSVNIEDIGDFSSYISEEPTLIDIGVLVLGFPSPHPF